MTVFAFGDAYYMGDDGMNRTLRIGLLLLAAVLSNGPTSWAGDLKYGLVYIIYDDGLGNCLYMVDVDEGGTCTQFSPAFAWDSAWPGVAVPWVDCQGDFLFKVAANKSGIANSFARDPYDGIRFQALPGPIPAIERTSDAIKARIPRSANFAGRRQRWNPWDKAIVTYREVKKIKLDNEAVRTVALFSLEPNTDDITFQLKRQQLDELGRFVKPIDAPFHKTARYFALETEAVTGAVEELPATRMDRPFQEYQHHIQYHNQKVPVILAP
jgi:hypothetical protein